MTCLLFKNRKMLIPSNTAWWRQPSRKKSDTLLRSQMFKFSISENYYCNLLSAIGLIFYLLIGIKKTERKILFRKMSMKFQRLFPKYFSLLQNEFRKVGHSGCNRENNWPIQKKEKPQSGLDLGTNMVFCVLVFVLVGPRFLNRVNGGT